MVPVRQYVVYENDARKEKLGKKRKKGEIDWHPFETDYGDHFETSYKAVEDIAGIVTALSNVMEKQPEDLRIYDPYYCSGGVKTAWKRAGFPKCLNENMDCYKVWEEKAEPAHDVVITNPPFSGEHKEWCVDYCVKTGKPWLVLLPGYCATKQYFNSLLRDQQPIFFVPNESYTFTHPEGTGYDDSPFFSIWMGSLGPYHKQVMEACRGMLLDVRVSESVGDLKLHKDVPTAKRPNPKQRKKMKKQESW